MERFNDYSTEYFERVLLVNPRTHIQTKVPVEKIDWNLTNPIKTNLGYEMQFVTTDGKTYQSDGIVCETEWQCQKLISRTQNFLYQPSKWGYLYMFCCVRQSNPKIINYYEDGATKPVKIPFEDFVRTYCGSN